MGPIFVGGASRSGKTLMRWMLSSHPDIVVTRRTEMWSRFSGRFGDLGKPGNLERCLGAMMARSQIAALEPDLERVRRDFAEGERTYGRLFALVNEQYAERCGKPRWGDQSPSNERFADAIMSAYTTARFIHLIRDPRDCYAAILLEKAKRRPGAAGVWASSWTTSAALARDNVERYPDAYRVVRYETLVAEPEQTMRDVCDLLGEPFDPAMLRMEEVERYRELRESTGSPISTAFVGQYARVLSPTDLVHIQAVADEQMRSFGYAPEAVRLSAGERIRLAAAWPALRTRRRVQPSGHRRPAPAADAGGGR